MPIDEYYQVCPKDLTWLKSMYNMLPPDVFKNSKLGKYEHCLRQEEETPLE